MKTLTKNLWMMAAMFCLTAVLTTSCLDEDERVGSDISGHWFGDMDMYFNGERAIGSEIQFTTTGWGFTKGYGWEIDYYDGLYFTGKVKHNFNWYVGKDLIIHLNFDDPALDCAIVDYSLTAYTFKGFIADPDTYQNLTSFYLRSYDEYWDEYGYGGYGDYIPVKGERNFEGNDSIATGEMKEIRGVNMKKD